ncbi:hypothetical protein MMC29_005598 [Sticta canariensis]|nr:hypothetical protein [Sticta canariensis]
MDICPQDEPVFSQGFAERLTECIPEEMIEDQARKNTSMQHSIAILDLDAVFGGSATDLEDEDEEPAPTKTTTGGSSANGAKSSRSTKSILRSLLPEDLSGQIDEFQDELPADFHEESQRTFARFFSEANVEWRHMWKASKELRESGVYVPKKPKEADRSCDWFWDNGRPSETKSAPSVQAEADENELPFHHVNFLGHPVYHKSSTPAAVSLWLVYTSGGNHPFHPFSRQGVIMSQATKLIDPFVYFGPEDLLAHSGTELRNAVVGLVERLYSEEGTWPEDEDDENDELLRNPEDWIRKCVKNNGTFPCALQAPYEMYRVDCEDTIINDGKDSHPPKPPRRNPDEAFNCTPSKLRTVELADHASVKVAEVGSKSVAERVVEEGDRVPEEVVEQADTAPEEVVEEENGVPEEVVEQADTAPEEVLEEENGVPEEVVEQADTAPEEVVEEENGVPEEVVEQADTAPEEVVEENRVPEEVVEQADTAPEEAVEEMDIVSRLGTAAWKDLSASLRGLAPFLELKSFQPRIGRDVGKTSEVEISCGDLDQIQLDLGLNGLFYGPIAIAVGHKAFQMANWVSSRIW